MLYRKVMADNSKSSGICLSDNLNPLLQAQFCFHSKSVKVQVLVNLCSYHWRIHFFLAVCFPVCFSFVTGPQIKNFLNTVLTSVLPHLPVLADTLCTFWSAFLQVPPVLNVGLLEAGHSWRTCGEAPPDSSSLDEQPGSERETIKWRRTLLTLLPRFLPPYILHCKRVQDSGIDANPRECKAWTAYAFASVLHRIRG